jgi:biotin carboxylase
MRETLREASIPQPKYLLFSQSQTKKAFSFFSSMDTGAVIKPINSGHSYGARFIEKNTSYARFKILLAEATQDLQQSYDEWMNFNSIEYLYLIEEFIPGNVISYDGVIEDINSITFIGTSEFEMMPPPLLQQVGHTSPPWSPSSERILKGQNYVSKIINALDLKFCGFHCEIKFINGEPMLIEIAARLAGGQVLETYQNVSKFNIYYIFWSIFGLKSTCNQSYILNNNSYIAETRTGVFHNQQGKVVKSPSLKEYRNDLTNTKIVFNGKRKNDWIVHENKIYDSWIGEIQISSSTLEAKTLKLIREKTKKALLSKYSLNNRIPKKVLLKRIFKFISRKIPTLVVVFNN